MVGNNLVCFLYGLFQTTLTAINIELNKAKDKTNMGLSENSEINKVIKSLRHIVIG